MIMENKEDFYIDIKHRAMAIYEQYRYIIKEVLESEFDISKYILNLYFRDDSNLGGKAWSDNYLDYIQINKGVIDNFFEYFYGFTKKNTEDFLKALHVDEDEEASYEYIKFDDNGNPNFFDSKVIDYKLAGLLTIFVSRFIITHELGHLLNGHCEFINSKDNNSLNYISMFEEDNRKVIKNVSPLDFRTLEMDADAFAATDNIRNLLLIYDNFEEKVDKDLNIKPIELFYWWSFAIRSNFLITQRILNDEEYKLDKKHLPSEARWVLILGSVTSFINENLNIINYRAGDNKENLLKALVAGFKFAENCYSERTYTKYNSLEETIKSTDYKHYASATLENWEKLRDKLTKFSRLPLYKSDYIV
ncbi:hypothetical protein [Paenibacillus pseudetheri]|uniref:IrrE N-terminal-like domain-containing protein n=1 Tax=Paenibacillus pseudetheri TaxID=2897682 RepID=A0ABM9BDA5_9BACL|nr:hypothetical protein [Paenibacillus pseudetheri]CAH1056679.1 hypothetical protein PAECIP111894_02832 [Paenibacillus pseudetheri]